MGGMAAFLLLPASADLTLADVEAWVARARSLGADDDSVVRVGEPPLESKRDGSLALCVPVTVTRTVLPSDTGSAGSATGQRTRRRRARGNTGSSSATTAETQVGAEPIASPETEESDASQAPRPATDGEEAAGSGQAPTNSARPDTGAPTSTTAAFTFRAHDDQDTRSANDRARLAPPPRITFSNPAGS
ncbi:hypothetical protein DFJ64_0725 [Thermasporomyces composti]|jgi:hypothetical protein|uniref:Uncharacterized protein n=2 Tax=Thermasporomyces composti TaxID=696763 RepID=A0A3D9V1G0_THECX|nr:hypothetical protein DFJ64_0725 [Thermasporomyces composti]